MRSFLAGLSLLLITALSAAIQQTESGSPPACQITDEDYAVYSAVLNKLAEDPVGELGGNREIILVDSTVSRENANGHRWGLKSESKQAPASDTIRNFNTRTAAGCH